MHECCWQDSVRILVLAEHKEQKNNTCVYVGAVSHLHLRHFVCKCEMGTTGAALQWLLNRMEAGYCSRTPETGLPNVFHMIHCCIGRSSTSMLIHPTRDLTRSHGAFTKVFAEKAASHNWDFACQEHAAGCTVFGSQQIQPLEDSHWAKYSFFILHSVGERYRGFFLIPTSVQMAHIKIFGVLQINLWSHFFLFPLSAHF